MIIKCNQGREPLLYIIYNFTLYLPTPGSSSFLSFPEDLSHMRIQRGYSELDITLFWVDLDIKWNVTLHLIISFGFVYHTWWAFELEAELI